MHFGCPGQYLLGQNSLENAETDASLSVLIGTSSSTIPKSVCKLLAISTKSVPSIRRSDGGESMLVSALTITRCNKEFDFDQFVQNFLRRHCREWVPANQIAFSRNDALQVLL